MSETNTTLIAILAEIEARFDELQKQIADLGCVPVGDDDSVVSGKPGDLPDRDFEIFELFLYGTRLSFPDEGVATKGYQQDFLLGFLSHGSTHAEHGWVHHDEMCASNRSRRTSSKYGWS